jgi:hypothetical protein
MSNNFKQDYIDDKINYDNIVEYIDTWHTSSSSLSLMDYLGLTDKEYHLMSLDDGSLKKELDNLKNNKMTARLKRALLLSLY